MKKNYTKPEINLIIQMWESAEIICASQIERSDDEVEEFDTKAEQHFEEESKPANPDVWEQGW